MQNHRSIERDEQDDVLNGLAQKYQDAAQQQSQISREIVRVDSYLKELRFRDQVDARLEEAPKAEAAHKPRDEGIPRLNLDESN